MRKNPKETDKFLVSEDVPWGGVLTEDSRSTFSRVIRTDLFVGTLVSLILYRIGLELEFRYTENCAPGSESQAALKGNY